MDRVPLISIVTPVLNGARTLRQTLASIAQQEGAVEHIVCDAGSTDGTQDIVHEFSQKYNVRLLPTPGAGIYESIRLGFAEASGDILCWINADDYYLPGALHTVREIFRSFPRADWITGIPTWYFDAQKYWQVSEYLPIYSRTMIRRGLHRRNGLGFLQQESMFWRRSLYETSGGAARLQSYALAGDFHLWRGFAQSTPLWTVDTALAVFRISDHQVSRQKHVEYDMECGGIKLPRWFGRLGYLWKRGYSLLFRHRRLSLKGRKPAGSASPTNGGASSR